MNFFSRIIYNVSKSFLKQLLGYKRPNYIFLFIFIPYALFSFGKPVDYNIKAKVVFPKNFKAVVSTLHNENASKETELYSSSIPALILSYLENINWTFRKDTKAIKFYYGQNGKLLNKLNFKNQNSKSLTKNWLEEQEIKNKDEKLKTKGIAGLDKNFIPVIWNKTLYNTDFHIKSKKSFIRDYCIRKNISFFIYGSYRLTGKNFKNKQMNKVSGKHIKLELAMFQLDNDSIKTYSFDLLEKNYSNNLEKKIFTLKQDLSGKKLLEFSLQSNPEKSLVYVDGKYLGLTPITNRTISQGIHIIEIEKSGFFKKKYKVNIVKKANFSAELLAIKTPGKLQLTSYPPGARVYIGVAFAGFTPLQIDKIPEGNHRIRIHSDEYIDQFRTISITKQQKDFSLKIILEKGDTASYYNVNKKIFWDYNYYDLSIGAFGGFTISLLGALYFEVQKSNTYDELRAKVPTDIKKFSSSDYKTKKKYENKIDSYKTYSAGMQISAGMFIGLSLYFFIQYVNLGDIDIALNKSKKDRIKSSLLASNVNVESYLFSNAGLQNNDIKQSDIAFNFKIQYRF